MGGERHRRADLISDVMGVAEQVVEIGVTGMRMNLDSSPA
jgi:hypothetical protein